MVTQTAVKTMAFYHENGLVPAWEQAMRFAGEGGRIATLPDIIETRLNTRPGDAPWEMYFSTLSAEYFGYGASGKPILIVAHGIGPMSTLKGILKAYSYEYNDKERNHRGGRISQEEFLALERGDYGPVSIVDLAEYVFLYDYPFMEVINSRVAKDDMLLKARLGPKAAEYIDCHTEHAVQWHLEQKYIAPENRYNFDNWEEHLARRRLAHHRDARTDWAGPYILHNEDAANCSYGFRDWHKNNEYVHALHLHGGGPLAHLLSIGGLVNLHHVVEKYGTRHSHESLVSDISCHEWWNGVRIAAIRPDESNLHGIHPGFDVRKTLRDHWQELMKPVSKPRPIGFCMLMKIGDQWFTQYPKKGERMDTHEAEYRVISVEPIGQAVEFKTTSYHSVFFKYGINEMSALAPIGSNAYALATEPEVDTNPDFHRCMVQFYHIEADTTHRLVRQDKLENDYNTLVRLTIGE